jgi:serine/threonine protein kinase
MSYRGRAVGRPTRGIVAVTNDTTYQNALMLNSMLLEYRLESVLGAGGFGMTYLGWDSYLEKHVAIKEYLPGDLAIRALDGSIVPVSTQSEYNYQWGLERFIQEARTLAKFSHPNIVRVNRLFEANGTSYMVMDYAAGESLYRYLRRAPMPDAAVLKSILLPILDGLEAIHQAGFLHRDIKPSNVFIRACGSPLLIDFGAARLMSGNNPERLTAIVSPGYAPLEQYSVEGDQGPWSDIYALSGVMYRAVTDENPPDAIKRKKADAVPAGLAVARARYDERFLKAIEWGLQTDAKLRPQNVAQWRELFSGRTPISVLSRAAVSDATPPPRTISAAALSGAVGTAVAQKAPAQSVVTQSGPRTGIVTAERSKWMWRAALLFGVAIVLASFVEQRAMDRDGRITMEKIEPARRADAARKVSTMGPAARDAIPVPTENPSPP